MENDVLKWKPTFCYRIRPIEAANYSFEYYALNTHRIRQSAKLKRLIGEEIEAFLADIIYSFIIR